MGAIVPDEFQTARVVPGQELDLGVTLDGIGEIGNLPIDRHRDCALGQRRRNAFGDIEAGSAVRVVPTGAVGKAQRDHFLVSCSLSAYECR